MTDIERPATFFSPALPENELLVSGLHGFEGVSRLSEIHLTLILQEDEPLDAETVKEVLRSPAAVSMSSADVLPVPWFGIIRQLDLLHVRQGRETIYRAVLVPSVWYLTQTVRSRVFLEMSVETVIAEVLVGAGLVADDHFEIRLSGGYPIRETIVQYQESDFDFLSRLLEHEGIFYFFEYTESGEKMVIGDSNNAFATPPQFDEITFSPRSTAEGQTPGFLSFARTYRVLPEQMMLREYNYQTPNVGIHAGISVDKDGFGMHVLYGEHFSDDDDGLRYAQLRAEELVAVQQAHRGRSTVRGLHAGDCFRLVGHSFNEFDDVEYVVTGMHHSLEISTSGGPGRPFSSDLEVLPKSVPFRPPRLTRKPRIHGLMHGKVDGEAAGTPAPIDEQGRYRIILPFDLAGEVGIAASRWMRMAQTFTGPAYGMHFPLHIGAEVVVAHIDGDPDRPIIVGSVPNPSTMTTVNQENATQSVMRTMGDIVFELEDDA